MTQAVLSIRNLRKTFAAELAPVRALRGVDLELTAGAFVAIMGPSGCGKSTLLNLVAGLDTTDDGEITLTGAQFSAMSEDDLVRMRRRQIGIVFQFFNLLDGMTALENVVLPAMIAGSKRKIAQSRARDLLDVLGLSDKLDRGSGRALRRSAATIGDCARAREPANIAPCRRTHKSAGQRRWRGSARAVSAASR